MAAAKQQKVSLKEIKAPDEFQSSMARVIEFFRLWGGWVLAGVVVILLAVAGAVWLTHHKESSRIQESAAFDKAAGTVYASALQRDDPAADKDAEAAKKAADEAKAKARAAEADLDKYASANAGTTLGKLALVAKAAAASQAGDAEAALQALQAFLATDAGASFAFVLWEAQGNAADAAGKRDVAEKAYTELTKAPSALARSYGWLHLGDLYNPATRLKDGEPSDKAKAKEFYDKGLKELGGEVALMPPAQNLAKRTLQARLVSVTM